MNHVPAHRLTFSSPAAQRIREAERAACERMEAEAHAAEIAPEAPPEPDSIIPPPSAGPLLEGAPDTARVPTWWDDDAITPAALFPTIATIKRVVCDRYGVSHLDLISHRRFRALARSRQIVMYLCRELTPRSMPEIGRRIGGRDHTTVLHGARAIAERMQTDPALAAEVSELRALFEEHQS